MRERDVSETIKALGNRVFTSGMIVDYWVYLHPEEAQRKQMAMYNWRKVLITETTRILRAWIKYGYIESITTIITDKGNTKTNLYQVVYNLPDFD